MIHLVRIWEKDFCLNTYTVLGIICTLGETFVWPVLYFMYILFHKDWRLLYLQQNYCPLSVLLSSLYSLPKVNGNCFDMYKILYAIGTKIWYVLGTKFFRLSIWIMYQNTLFPWLKKMLMYTHSSLYF